jgi:hypothetical protein
MDNSYTVQEPHPNLVSSSIAALTAPCIEQKRLRAIAMVLEHPWNKTLSLWGDFQQLPGVEAIESTGVMERAMGIEPTSEAWEASILPLYDARSEPYANKPARLLQEFFIRRFMLECRVALG